MSRRISFMPDWRALAAFMRDSKADWKPKAAIVICVLYLIWPLDLMPDLAPVIGWLDDVGFLALASTYLVYASNKHLFASDQKALNQKEKE